MSPTDRSASMAAVNAEASLLADPAALESLYEEIERAGRFALDTEFVSERTFRPELALIQVATPERVAVIDPIAMPDLRRLWEFVADPGVLTVMHAGEQEARFCWLAVGALPGSLFDVQLAAGFSGERFPLAYHRLVERWLGVRPPQGQTRSDWLRRPLAAAQIAYAREDVQHLLPLWERLDARLIERGRQGWLAEETARRLGEVERGLTTVAWRRVGSLSALGRRGLAVVREVALWREALAERRNAPRRHVLRDDLIVSIASARPRSREELGRLRGLERIGERTAHDLLACVERALALPAAQLPERGASHHHPRQARMLGLLLEAVLESLCVEHGVDAPLVGSAGDLRALVAWRLTGRDPAQTPALMQGWRAALCGQRLEDALAGRLVVRVTDLTSEHPITVTREQRDG